MSNLNNYNLRDHLLQSLRQLPGKRTFRIHVLITSKRKHAGLYPHAPSPRPRTHLQDILTLLSEESEGQQRVFVSAIEAHLYTLSDDRAILYIAKVDGTGQGLHPPPTSTLIRSFVTFFADPALRRVLVTANTLWLHVFARAQNQYLFPNSIEFPEKRVLSDIKLCGWWRALLGDVARCAPGKASLYYILPGYSELEAVQALKPATDSWTYGHPYSQSDYPLPGGGGLLSKCIPSFEDDPKTRFMAELAADTLAPPSPKRKRQKTGESEVTKPHDNISSAPRAAIDNVTPGEFWERMSFRQECISGAVTAFFVAVFSAASRQPVEDPDSPRTQNGIVPPALYRRLMSSLLTGNEFSTRERGERGTRVMEEAIQGLVEAPVANLGPISTHPADGNMEPPRTPPQKHARLPSESPSWPDDYIPSPTIYNSHIFGEISMDNPVLPPQKTEATPQPVTVLAVRKKRKT